MQRNYFKNVMTLAIVAAASYALGSSASAATVALTDSNQLNLSGRTVLAAVNVYSAQDSVARGNIPMTGPIQGVAFDNFDHATVGAQALTAGGTLTTIFPNTTFNSGRRQFVTGTITGTGADEPFTEEWASGMTYFAGGNNGSLSFAFGAGNANTAVEVQIAGGDEGWGGQFTALVGAADMGTINGDFNSTTAHLLTFNTTTDAAGNLLIDLRGDTNYAGLSGVIVTAERTASVPEPATATLAMLGLGGLLMRRRRAA